MTCCQLLIWRWTWVLKERKNSKQYTKSHSWHAKSYKEMLSCGILIGVGLMLRGIPAPCITKQGNNQKTRNLLTTKSLIVSVLELG